MMIYAADPQARADIFSQRQHTDSGHMAGAQEYSEEESS